MLPDKWTTPGRFQEQVRVKPDMKKDPSVVIREVLAKKKEREPKQAGRKERCRPITIVHEFERKFKETFGVDAPYTGNKYLRPLKQMLEQYGGETMMKMVHWLFDNWELFRREKRITDPMPNLGILIGFQAYFYGQVKTEGRAEREKETVNLNEF